MKDGTMNREKLTLNAAELREIEPGDLAGVRGGFVVPEPLPTSPTKNLITDPDAFRWRPPFSKADLIPDGAPVPPPLPFPLPSF